MRHKSVMMVAVRLVLGGAVVAGAGDSLGDILRNVRPAPEYGRWYTDEESSAEERKQLIGHDLDAGDKSEQGEKDSGAEEDVR